jgi:hypothetical protein
MTRMRMAATTLVAVGVLAATPAALAAGGAPGGGGGGGGGGGAGGGGTCAPLTMPLDVVHSHGAYGVTIPATVKNCSTVNESWVLRISLAGHAPAAYVLSTGGAVQFPGDSLTTLGASFGAAQGQTYTVTGTLTETAPAQTVLSTITTTVTIPNVPLAA